VEIPHQKGAETKEAYKWVYGCGTIEVALPHHPLSPPVMELKRAISGQNCLIGCLVLQVLWLLHRKKYIIGLLLYSKSTFHTSF